MIRIIILGAGNVAKHLYDAFLKQKSVMIVQCYNRKGVLLHPNQDPSSITKDINTLQEADIYIIAISDDAIREVSSQIPVTNKLVVHTSGSVSIDAIHQKNRTGVFYPLQTFSNAKTVDFETIPFCLEAMHKKDIILLNKIASYLTKKVYEISSEQRKMLHLAAVFVNNFTNHLFSIGHDICREHDIPFEILYPLILETAQKITHIEPDHAQTGPALRNDIKTIKRHSDAISNTSQKEIYQILTKAIQSKYGKKL